MLAHYLRNLREIRASGQAVQETSYYGTLETLLNEVGKTLKPRVRTVINLQNRGAGIPDGGLFSSDQLASEEDPTSNNWAGAMRGEQVPARGVLEVKGTAEEVDKIAASAQVAKYLERYGQVLVTNYRDFLPVSKGENGAVVRGEPYRLAEDEASFWRTNLSALIEEHEGRFEDYLRRVMLQRAPLADPKDVAWFLASYAREAKARIERSDLPTLQGVRGALEEALGIHFQGERGDAFFRSTLIQTLFYGLFSAWVLWSKTAQAGEHFDWRLAPYTLKVPVIRALFYRVADPERLETLDLSEVLGWTGGALNRVNRPAFFERFNEGEAVQYFYEPFLEAFDPELRKQLGVWYTPPEIVRYMVERVDRVLRDELDLPDGLASENVFVLDPCCGTGAYLVEVLARIEKTLRERGDDALLGSDLKKAAVERVFGFELLLAPFVVAHLQMGLSLQNAGATLGGARTRRRLPHERADGLEGGRAAQTRLSRVSPRARRGERNQARDENPGCDRQSPLQRLRGDGSRGGARTIRRLPHHDTRPQTERSGAKRPLREVFQDGGAPNRRADRARRDLLYLQLLLAGRAFIHGDAREVSGTF